MKQIQLTEEQFDEQYHPVKNHLDNNASFDGCMFETYGAELQHIVGCLKGTKRQVWTIIESDRNDNIYYLSGLHIVNRLGFLVTLERVPEDTEVEVFIDIESHKLPE
ncbi:MAG: hypothetical protein WC333_02100 [Dehalococcoidia bacterium]|jgi:primosomal protein N''